MIVYNLHVLGTRTVLFFASPYQIITILLVNYCDILLILYFHVPVCIPLGLIFLIIHCFSFCVSNFANWSDECFSGRNQGYRHKFEQYAESDDLALISESSESESDIDDDDDKQGESWITYICMYKMFIFCWILISCWGDCFLQCTSCCLSEACQHCQDGFYG